MNRPLRLPAALALVAMVALISAGCGGNGSSSGGPSTATPAGSAGTGGDKNATRRKRAVKFAECMRANGVSAFPDPNASGELTIDAVANGASVDTNSAAFEQAMGVCKDLEPPGFTGGKVTPGQRPARLAFAQCIRDHGVKDFPDPADDQPLVDTRRIPSAATEAGMSVLNAAMQACPAEAAGVTGGP